MDKNTWFELAARPMGINTRQSSSVNAHKTLRSRLDLRKNFFSVRLVNVWNSLPDSVRSANTVNHFKLLYDEHQRTTNQGWSHWKKTLKNTQDELHQLWSVASTYASLLKWTSSSLLAATPLILITVMVRMLNFFGQYKWGLNLFLQLEISLIILYEIALF